MDAVAIFVKVVEAGSFSSAAKRLAMPKTTVSAKVAGLERRLGVRLLQRTTRKLRMTEAGEKYFHHCAIAVREIEQGEAALQLAKERPFGVLKVTAPVGFGHSLLPRIAHAYANKYPDVSLDFIITNRTVDLVAEGVDLAIRSGGSIKDSSLISRRFFEARSNLWASPDYLKTVGKLSHPRDLAKARFVCHPGYKSVMLTNGKIDFELQMQGRILTDDFEMIKDMSVLGEGIGWSPDLLVREEERKGRLVRVLPQWWPKQRAAFYFIFPSHRYAQPKLEGFIQTALELV